MNSYLSEYASMWLVAMFDLPVKTKRDRRNYARFRNRLLDHGFIRLQFSVYARYCESEAKGDNIERHLVTQLPPQGHVRFLMITDRQFGKMKSFLSKKTVENETAPKQIMLF